jgi:UDP-N-acetylglucosamine 2-epimerase (non-hydrolysing)
LIKVLCAIGTRPEAIKMAPVVSALAKRRSFSVRVCVTAQHREMLDQALRLFGLRPHIDLDVMRPNQGLAATTTRILDGMDRVLARERPDWLLVHGDTTTAMTSGLAAFYRHVRVAHVEAGLRSGSYLEPFPEELNRRVADQVSTLLFAPTKSAAANLRREGISADRIRITGNTVVDALRAIARLPVPSRVRKITTRLDGRALVLVTAHRRENLGKNLASICDAIAIVARKYPDDVQFVYPVHMNPNVSGPVHTMLGGIPNVTLTAPLDYVEFVHLLKACRCVMTDSGGIQEEAPTFRKPVLVLRDRTERPEAVACGSAKIVGTDTKRIVATLTRALTSDRWQASLRHLANPFGDGFASRRIVSALAAER